LVKEFSEPQTILRSSKSNCMRQLLRIRISNECDSAVNHAICDVFSGRVRERRCRHSLPSEPDVGVSPHPAQAATRPHVSEADFTTVQSRLAGR
jgi:hypothetical protein